MRDIIIGNVKTENLCTICEWRNANLSSNSKVFVLRCKEFCDIRVIIDKQSKDGVELTEWLNSLFLLNMIIDYDGDEWLDYDNMNKLVNEKSIEYILPNLTLSDIQQMTSKIEAESYQNGYHQAQSDIRKSLGL